MSKALHIIAFDVPFPANYGGVIDVYYKIVALHKQGVKIHLHTHEYGRGNPKELDNFCESVTFYKRRKRLPDLLSKRPFIVESRINENLLENLKRDEFPILIEGLHNCWLLEHTELRKRISVRTHNVEYQYYRQLASNTSGIKKLYFLSESRKLKKYESILRHAKTLFAISTQDVRHYRSLNPSVVLLNAFYNPLDTGDKSNSENYILYHGNLGVAENIKALDWLIDKVFSRLAGKTIIIAGKNPSTRLKNKIYKHGIQLVENPDENEMSQLLLNASAHVLYSSQDSGIKLKLLNALQTSAPVIVNPILLDGNKLEDWVIVANNEEDFIQKLNNISSLDNEFVKQRRAFLEQNFNNTEALDCLFEA